MQQSSPSKDGRSVYDLTWSRHSLGGEVENWAKSVLVANSETAPDGLPAFKALATHSSHERIVTGGGAKSVKMPAFRWVNTLLGNLKTGLSGTFHACDFDKYGYCYLAEFQYRFNRRKNLKTIFPRLLRAATTTSKLTEAWLRIPEYSC